MGVVALLATSCNKNKDQETATIKTFNQQFEVVDSDFGPGYDGEKVYLDQSMPLGLLPVRPLFLKKAICMLSAPVVRITLLLN